MLVLFEMVGVCVDRETLYLFEPVGEPYVSMHWLGFKYSVNVPLDNQRLVVPSLVAVILPF